MIKIIGYIKSLIRANTLDSSKSFAMVSSVLLGFFLGIVLGFCLIWDVCTNGYIRTDSETILCTLIGIGSMITLSSVSKIAKEIKTTAKNKTENEKD